MSADDKTQCRGIAGVVRDVLTFSSNSIAFPLSCLGIGLISVWTELSYIEPPIAHAGASALGFALFDTTTIIAAIVIALAVRLLPSFTSLAERPGCLIAAALLLVASTCFNFGSALGGFETPALFTTAAIAGGVGLALVFIMWWEVLGHLDPVQMILCYVIGLAGRVGIIWVFSALPADRLWVCLCAIALTCVGCLGKARSALAREGVFGGTGEEAYSLPVKPMLVVAIVSFAMCFVSEVIGNTLGTNGNPGGLIAAIVVGAMVLVRREGFQFKRLWQLTLACSVLVVPLGLLQGAFLQMAGILESVSYETCLMLVYVILVNMVYRFSASATWLFSIELALTLVAAHVGSGVGSTFITSWPWSASLALLLGGCVTAMLVVLAMAVAFSIKGLEGAWSTIIKTPIADDYELALEKTRLGVRCREVAAAGGLTKREEETLLLLLRGKKPDHIAKEFCVETSTVRTHVKHIYTKLDVHSKKELKELVGLK